MWLDFDKSETHLLMAILIKKQPVDNEFLSLGLTYKMQENHKNALEYFNKALEENVSRAAESVADVGWDTQADLLEEKNYGGVVLMLLKYYFP